MPTVSGGRPGPRNRLSGRPDAYRAAGAPAGTGRPAIVRPASRRSARSAQGGFTLLEVLVVVVITAILVAALTLSVGATGERQLANASERFQALLGHACNEAELTGRELGAVVSVGGYAFRRLDGDTWRDVYSDGELRARQWPAGLHLEFTREGQPLELAAPQHDAPQLVCFSSGELTPFALTLALGDTPVRYRIEGADDGTLKSARIESPR